MHSTKPISSAGQTSGWTTRLATNNIATETNILTVDHNSTLTALAAGDMLESRLVMPRAIKAPGTTTTAAPYSIDHATSGRRVINHPTSAATTPTATWVATTRHGETGSSWALKAATSSRLSRLKFLSASLSEVSSQRLLAATVRP